MRLLFFVMLSFLFEFTALADVVRVRLEKFQKEITLSGRAVLFQGNKSPFQKLSFLNKRTYQIHFDSSTNGWVVTSGADEWNFNSEMLSVQGQDMESKGVKLPSKLFVARNQDKTILDLMAVVESEEYIKGVISSEMSSTWPLEALKAQAVASRSYAIYQMKKFPSRTFHLDGSIHDQVFEHFGEGLSPYQKAKIERAVMETKREVLENEMGEVEKAYFHADCGGQTDSADVVFGVHQKSGVAKDTRCPLNPRATWRFKISQAVFSKILNLKFEKWKLQIISTTPAGRVEKIKFSAEDSTLLTMTGEELREKLGYNKLRSTHFWYELKKDTIEFFGMGYGHGVGMCQWGARVLAEEGKNYRQILSHYYPSLKVMGLLNPKLNIKMDLVKLGSQAPLFSSKLEEKLSHASTSRQSL